MVDWLSDLSWVPNGAVVLISCTAGAAGSKPKASPSTPHPTKAATPAEDGGKTADSNLGGGDKSGGSAASAAGVGRDGSDQPADEDEGEALALAALGRIRESYKTRARERQAGGGGGAGRRARSDVPEEEAGRRMAEKRREVEGTEKSRQASC